MLTTTAKALMSQAVPQSDPGSNLHRNKVTIIGAGTLGTAIAFTLISKNITSHVVLIDKEETLLRGEGMDIQHATAFMGNVKITPTSDFECSENSKVCVVTIGARTTSDASKIDNVNRNTEIFKTVIPDIVKYSPNCILLIMSHPVDIMSYVAWKLSGFPPNRVIGSGTCLQSYMFRQLMAERLSVAPHSCQAYIIGEAGPNSIPVWSGLTLGGVHVRDINTDLGSEDDPEEWYDIHNDIINQMNEVNNLKGCGSWALALSICKIVKSVLGDKRVCLPVSTHIKGCYHGADKDIFMSLPCILGENGVHSTVRQSLNEKTMEQLQESADAMYEIQKTLNIPACFCVE